MVGFRGILSWGQLRVHLEDMPQVGEFLQQRAADVFRIGRVRSDQHVIQLAVPHLLQTRIAGAEGYDQGFVRLFDGGEEMEFRDLHFAGVDADDAEPSVP